VQCKQWQAWKVGVKVIRELYGVMASDHIDAGIVVTCGEFTAEAIIFAENKPLQLVDGVDLLPLIQTTGFGMTTSPPAPPVIASPLTSSVPPALPLPTHGQQITHVSTHVLLPPTCPRCGSVMVARTARRGSNAGEQFWGCPDYPKCKGLREMQ
jgi:restriction system protein